MPSIARGQIWLCQPLSVSTVPNTSIGGIYLIHSNYRGLDEEVEQLIVQDYGNVTSVQFAGSYYHCYTVLRVLAILRHFFWKYTL